MVAGRLAEHDERVRLRRAGKAATGAKWHAVVLARECAADERAKCRLRGSSHSALTVTAGSVRNLMGRFLEQDLCSASVLGSRFLSASALVSAP